MSSDTMKLILAIVPDADKEPILSALTKADFHVTAIASTGGFLRRGKATLLMGVEKERVQNALQLIRENSTPPIDPELKRAVVFVLKVDHFTQI
jgi:uncharacterized protein YaaQ